MTRPMRVVLPPGRLVLPRKAWRLVGPSVTGDYAWGEWHRGMDLDTTPLPDAGHRWARVTVCLNVFSDASALRDTVPHWADHADRVVAVDGAYGRDALSADGTREFLRERFGARLTLIDAPGRPQTEKRTLALTAEGHHGDLRVVIDADEAVEGFADLRHAPQADVLWLRVTSPLYRDGYWQPRAFAWKPGLHYAGRHHWTYAGGRLAATHQYGGWGLEHRRVGTVTVENRPGPIPADRQAQVRVEAGAVAWPGRTERSDALMARRDHLRIAALAPYDAGLACSRLHTALNRTTPHQSVFGARGVGPYGARAQYVEEDTEESRALMRAAMSADVLHHHVRPMPQYRGRPDARHVLHHHGSWLRTHARTARQSASDLHALVLVSNLELLTYAPDATFLPNAVPVARYRRLWHAMATERDGRRPFRVAHSPSKRHLKGTTEFLAAVADLRRRGVAIEAVLIEQTAHGAGLALKASCDAVFDSFWLGMQCSGIEGAAMGLPVVAGDETVAARYVERHGTVPYTFANDRAALTAALGALATDEAFWMAESERVHRHVVDWHDEASVALQYLDALDARFGWRSNWRPRP